MTAFRVWAPRPSAVELVVALEPPAEGTPAGVAAGLERRPMTAEAGGWWALDVPEAGPGSDYGFVLDGDGPFPDPRSSWQPAGVDGLSRLDDPAAFRWTDAGFVARPPADAVIVELHVGTFTSAGTFDAAIERLDALVDLGASHVELMPVVEFPGERGWGYDGVDPFAPHHAYGGPAGLRRLVDACHARGLAVLLDVVYNHVGPYGNHLAAFGPYFTDAYRTPWGPAVNFDGPGSDEVRVFVVDNAVGWCRDLHVDGLRLDAVHAIFDRSAVHVLEELAEAVHAAGGELGRDLVVVAESDLNDPRLVRPVELGGYGLDAQWNDDFRHALHVTLTGETEGFHGQYTGLDDLATALRETFVLAGRYSAFRGRRHGRPAAGTPANRFVGFLQNHDQVGNRAFGERSGALLAPDALRVAAAVVLLGPFVPLLFAGEEWGATTPFQYFTDHLDSAIGEAVRTGRSAEFPQLARPGLGVPDPQNPETFLRSRLDWTERDREPHAALLDWHRRLIAFRAAHPELRDGRHPDVRVDLDARWLAFGRGGVEVVANVADEPRRVVLRVGGPGRRELALASAEGVRLDGDAVELPALSVAVVAG